MTHDISHKNTSHIAITHVKNLSGKRLQKKKAGCVTGRGQQAGRTHKQGRVEV